MAEDIKIIANNKKAFHEYFVEDSYEAGIQLVGSEVKSIRLGNVNLKDSFVIIKNNECILINTHISPYEKGSFFNLDPKRDRRLLLNKNEIRKLKAKVEQKGYTIIPIKLYFKQALVKLEIALCKGKELHDKRQDLEDKQVKREIERDMKQY
jgi:SsrA-binding protein